MRIIFSRKGFDSTAGGGPSPIIDGRPISLPIPSGGFSNTTYAQLGLGAAAQRASRGKVSAQDYCHHDPMFLSNAGTPVTGLPVSGPSSSGTAQAKQCLFGQCGAAQTHLINQGVREGDVFLFFGLFRAEDASDPHHRIFGFLRIEERIDLTDCSPAQHQELAAFGHPHLLGMHASNDMIYRGPGGLASHASEALRLTVPGGPPSLWRRPHWLRPDGLTYHHRAERWLEKHRLRSVARGQEFVAKIGNRGAPRKWLEQILAEF